MVFGGAFSLLLVAGSLLFYRRRRLDLRCRPWLPAGEQTAGASVREQGAAACSVPS